MALKNRKWRDKKIKTANKRIYRKKTKRMKENILMNNIATLYQTKEIDNIWIDVDLEIMLLMDFN